MHVIDERGLVSPDAGDPAVGYWQLGLLEIMAEMQLRHGPYPAGWRRGLIDFARMPGSLDHRRLDRRLRLDGSSPATSHLVKYTQREFAEALGGRDARRAAFRP